MLRLVLGRGCDGVRAGEFDFEAYGIYGITPAERAKTEPPLTNGP